MILTIIGLQVGAPRCVGQEGAEDPMDRPWTTGFFKESVVGPCRITEQGLAGDGQADRVHHGGPDKAICVYPAEHHSQWAEEVGRHFAAGAFGENFTTTGLTEEEVCVGDVFRAGAVILQVTQPRQPCWKLARRWKIKDLAARVEHTGRTGWYFRVLNEGWLERGDRLILIERPSPQWTIAAANQVMHHRKSDLAAAAALAECEGLSQSWRESLLRRSGGEFSNG